MKSDTIEKTSLEDTFTISHTFYVDSKALYGMWINPDYFSKWLGPAGAHMQFINTNVKEGGTSQWSMTTADGLTKYGKLHFKTINPDHLLVYTQHFCDEDGNFIKAPFSATYPDVLLTTVNFIPVSANEVNMKITWNIFGDATDIERSTFNEMKPFMIKGWNESFEKIEALLVSAK